MGKVNSDMNSQLAAIQQQLDERAMAQQQQMEEQAQRLARIDEAIKGMQDLLRNLTPTDATSTPVKEHQSLVPRSDPGGIFSIGNQPAIAIDQELKAHNKLNGVDEYAAISDKNKIKTKNHKNNEGINLIFKDATPDDQDVLNQVHEEENSLNHITKTDDKGMLPIDEIKRLVLDETITKDETAEHKKKVKMKKLRYLGPRSDPGGIVHIRGRPAIDSDQELKEFGKVNDVANDETVVEQANKITITNGKWMFSKKQIEKIVRDASRSKAENEEYKKKVKMKFQLGSIAWQQYLLPNLGFDFHGDALSSSSSVWGFDGHGVQVLEDCLRRDDMETAQNLFDKMSTKHTNSWFLRIDGHKKKKSEQMHVKPRLVDVSFTVGSGSGPKIKDDIQDTPRHKVVLSAWLRFERREDELVGISSVDCSGFILGCPKAALLSGYDSNSVYDRCKICEGSTKPIQAPIVEKIECLSLEEEDDGVTFGIGDEGMDFVRNKIAALSNPFKAMLYGGFVESKRENIDFSHDGISLEGLRAVEVETRTRKVDLFCLRKVLELLSSANKFCCEEMNFSWDDHLASLVDDIEDALILIDYGLEEMANLFVASCLQVWLREIPSSLYNPKVMKIFCSSEATPIVPLVRDHSGSCNDTMDSWWTVSWTVESNLLLQMFNSEMAADTMSRVIWSSFEEHSEVGTFDKRSKFRNSAAVAGCSNEAIDGGEIVPYLGMSQVDLDTERRVILPWGDDPVMMAIVL